MDRMRSDFRDLEVYKIAREFRKEIYELVNIFPVKEKYLLADQLLRSSRSITANIAEGYGRFHYNDNIRFCRLARGSLYETLEHLIIAYDCNYIDEKLFLRYEEKALTIMKKLNGYISYLKKKNYSTT